MKTIRFAVRSQDGDYFAENEAGYLSEAKLWKTKRGAEALAKEWGSAIRPRQMNTVVEVEVVEVQRRSALN